MRRDTISYTFNFIDNCGREYDLQDGHELEATFYQNDYDFKNMTLNQAMTTLLAVSKKYNLELGKKLFIKSIFWEYFDHDFSGTTGRGVDLNLIHDTYVWGSHTNSLKGLCDRR